MFIQIKKDKIIRDCDIIGVFDLDTSTVSGITRSFLSSAEKNGLIEGLDILPKSFVLTERKIYFSSQTTGYINKNKF
ncbi:MAG: DUF370 domain-containing protein [Oscillospiraceae bacterium]|nr:DUF370 domain-containing protein [Oscillospiraceae bacterium]